jgi:hypothetical protein
VRGHIDEYLANTDGTNEMAKSKAIAFFHHLRPLHDALYAEMADMVEEVGGAYPWLSSYLSEARDFSIKRKEDFLDFTQQAKGYYHFDFFALEGAGFKADPSEFALNEAVEYTFSHNPAQVEMINSYVVQYGGSTIDGLGRILMRAPAKRMFRGYASDRGVLTNTNNKCSSLNVYGGFTV